MTTYFLCSNYFFINVSLAVQVTEKCRCLSCNFSYDKSINMMWCNTMLKERDDNSKLFPRVGCEWEKEKEIHEKIGDRFWEDCKYGRSNCK